MHQGIITAFYQFDYTHLSKLVKTLHRMKQPSPSIGIELFVFICPSCYFSCLSWLIFMLGYSSRLLLLYLLSYNKYDCWFRFMLTYVTLIIYYLFFSNCTILLSQMYGYSTYLNEHAFIQYWAYCFCNS